MFAPAACGSGVKQERKGLAVFYYQIAKQGIDKHSRFAKWEDQKDYWWEAIKDFVNDLSKEEVLFRATLYTSQDPRNPSNEAQGQLFDDVREISRLFLKANL
jgi:hypothetical protein